MKTKIFLLFVICLAPFILVAQKDFGDAPESALAYPSNGVIGVFPTCASVGPSGFIHHFNFGLYFLPTVDFEPDGNAGTCPSFAPYDLDECFNDGDAGIIFPQPFTITNGLVTLCPGSAGTSLGSVCTTINWGTNVDINIQNFMPNATIGYFNLLIDWDQNGAWGGSVTCPQGSVPEHAVANFPIPNPYAGTLSALGNPMFTSGPTNGFFWARFSLTEVPVPVPWGGSGTFEDGESEDYLIYVGDEDFGDAPEGSLAYPSTNINGMFPTCVNVGNPSSYIMHYFGNAYFGNSIDAEMEGNGGFCPAFNPNTYDKDECYQDNDAGLIVPGPYTIAGNVGNEVVVPCISPGTSLGAVCQNIFWGNNIDISVTGSGYVNVLIDWDQDGQWTYNQNTQCNGIVITEHVLVDFQVSSASSVPLSSFNPPSFMAGPYSGYVWTRFTISDVPVNSNWDGSGVFMNGETEDYLLELNDTASKLYKVPGSGMIPLKVVPNPVEQSSSIEFILVRAGKVRIEIADMQGKLAGTTREQTMTRGKHVIPVNALMENGTMPGNGIYIVRLFFNDQPVGFAKAVVVQ